MPPFSIPFQDSDVHPLVLSSDENRLRIPSKGQSYCHFVNLQKKSSAELGSHIKSDIKQQSCEYPPYQEQHQQLSQFLKLYRSAGSSRPWPTKETFTLQKVMGAKKIFSSYISVPSCNWRCESYKIFYLSSAYVPGLWVNVLAIGDKTHIYRCSIANIQAILIRKICP